MKKKWLLSLAIAGCMAVSILAPATVYADAQKVVTLGADLTEDQKTAILKYFGVLGQNVQTLYITNQDERNHLASYVPIEQIGTRTFSCALVNPTNNGGIRVKTANLNWVTSNMIASTLSTAGVVNCDVLAASPFEVSGTGALTGVIMAYEHASGTTLDEEKKEIATQELVVTGNIANEIGQQQATQIVNEIKLQVIQNDLDEYDDFDDVVDGVLYDVLDDNDVPATVNLSEEDRNLLKSLAEQIAKQQYSYDDVKDTLERVENNVTNNNTNNNNNEINVNVVVNNTDNNTNNNVVDVAQPAAEEQLNADSILAQTDESALTDLNGGYVVFDATNQDALDEYEQEQPPVQYVDDNGGFDIVTSDDFSEGGNPFENEGFVENFDQNIEENPAEAGDEGTEDGFDEPEAPGEFVIDDVKMTPNCSNSDIMNTLGTSVLFVDIKGYVGLTINEACCVITNVDANYNVEVLNYDEQPDKFKVFDLVDEVSGSVIGTRIAMNIAGDLVEEDTSYEASFTAQMFDPATNSMGMADASAALDTQDCGVSIDAWSMNDFTVGRTLNCHMIMDPETYAQAEIVGYDWNKVTFSSETITSDDPNFTMDLVGYGSTDVTVRFVDYEGYETIYKFAVCAN